jgi:hypothetical protein
MRFAFLMVSVIDDISAFLSSIVVLLFVQDIIGRSKEKIVKAAILETVNFVCMRKSTDDRA